MRQAPFPLSKKLKITPAPRRKIPDTFPKDSLQLSLLPQDLLRQLNTFIDHGVAVGLLLPAQFPVAPQQIRAVQQAFVIVTEPLVILPDDRGIIDTEHSQHNQAPGDRAAGRERKRKTADDDTRT